MYHTRWPELDVLVRRVRASESFTDALSEWIGTSLVTEILGLDEVGVLPSPVATMLGVDPHDLPGGVAQRRVVEFRAGQAAVGGARAIVLIRHPTVSEAARNGLAAGGNLGRLLLPLGRTRVALAVHRACVDPTGEPSDEVLRIRSRLDVAGTPIAWCEETVRRVAVQHRDLKGGRGNGATARFAHP
jgi:hypothetical protein